MFQIIKNLHVPAAVVAIGLCSGVGQAQESPEPSMDALRRAEEILAPWVSETDPGVSVAVSLRDQIVFAEGAGVANLEHGLPITPRSVFQVASVSKQFTAFAIFLLADENRIDLDADIRTYLPEMPPYEGVITVRHLLDHSSGLREQGTLAAMAGWMADDIHTPAQYLDLVVRQRGGNFEAGSQIEYSNTGYLLLAEIVARVSGQSFGRFIQARIFDPLDMTQSAFPDDRNSLIPERVSSYYPSPDGFRNVVAVSGGVGSTGLYTSALDLLKWAENFETRRVGSPRVFTRMSERFRALDGAVSTFGRGQENRVHAGLRTWSHGGRDAGFRSFLLRVPDADFEVAILSNRTDFDTAEMAIELMAAFLADHAGYAVIPDPVWSPANRAELEDYAGDYEIYPGVIFSFREQNGGLGFAPLGAPDDGFAVLPQIGPREFQFSATPDQAFIFEPGAGGQSPGVKFRIGLHGTIAADRVALQPFDASEVDLSDFAATCESDELATGYQLSANNSQLVAKHPRLDLFVLTPYQPDIFMSQGPLQRVEFVRSEAGQVIGFHASGPLAEGIWFACTSAPV